MFSVESDYAIPWKDWRLRYVVRTIYDIKVQKIWNAWTNLLLVI